MRQGRVDLPQIGRQGGRTFALVGAAAMVVASCTSGASRGTAPSQSQQTLAAPSANPSLFTVTARFDASSLGLDRPVALAIGPDGNLYVTDTSQAVAVISPDGNLVRRWGQEGTGPGELSFVSLDPSDASDVHASIAVGPDGQVYVSESGNYRIEVFSATGKYIRQFGSLGSAEGQFLAPFDLAVDTVGNVYVVDDKGGTVSKFSSTGDFVWRIGGFSAEDPDLVGYEHLASVDTHGRVVMTNDDKGRILYVDAKGHKVDAFTTHEGGACDVTVDAAGDTFVNYGCGGPGDTDVFDRTHRLIGGCYSSCPLLSSPRFGPKGEVFALGQDGTILKLEVTLP
jgi:DNA-binding beta-propeller fold protein YncE